jgi:hypothetical protein
MVRREMERVALANRHKVLNVEWLERNRKLFSADPSNPLAMTWLDEPNAEEYFGYGGLDCILLRNANGCWEGCLCIPQHFWIAQDSFHHAIPTLRVHGGVTRIAREESCIVVGFDTSHLEPKRIASWFSSTRASNSRVTLSDRTPDNAGRLGAEDVRLTTESIPSGTSSRPAERAEVDYFPVSMRFGVCPARGERYRTLSYCRRQLERLADQVLSYGTIARSSRLVQSYDWRWSCGGQIFPGATIDSRGRLILELLGGIGTADVLCLVRDFLRGKQRRKKSADSDKDLRLAEGLDDLLCEYSRDDEDDSLDDFGPCLRNLPIFESLSAPSLHDSLDRLDSLDAVPTTNSTT